jgi:hypothetical protein
MSIISEADSRTPLGMGRVGQSPATSTGTRINEGNCAMAMMLGAVRADEKRAVEDAAKK